MSEYEQDFDSGKFKADIWDILIDKAKPLLFEHEVKNAINSILEEAISKLLELDEKQRAELLHDARNSLDKFIVLMSNNAEASGNEIIQLDDFNKAKEEICPCWPCE